MEVTVVISVFLIIAGFLLVKVSPWLHESNRISYITNRRLVRAGLVVSITGFISTFVIAFRTLPDDGKKVAWIQENWIREYTFMNEGPHVGKVLKLVDVPRSGQIFVIIEGMDKFDGNTRPIQVAERDSLKIGDTIRWRWLEVKNWGSDSTGKIGGPFDLQPVFMEKVKIFQVSNK